MNELKTINEVELETGISAYTIRYYDKCGFFNPIARTPQGRRRFSADDISRLLLMDAFRKSGLSIDGLKYLAPLMDDPAQVDTVLEISERQIGAMDIQLEEMQLCRDRLKRFAEERTLQKLIEP